MRRISENGVQPGPGRGSGDRLGIDPVRIAESHVQFFIRLNRYVMGEQDDDDDGFVELASSCELRSWLDGEGARRFSHLPRFARLRDVHERFHDDARTAVGHLHKGGWTAAQRVCSGAFAAALRTMLITLAELNDEAGAEGRG